MQIGIHKRRLCSVLLALKNIIKSIKNQFEIVPLQQNSQIKTIRIH